MTQIREEVSFTKGRIIVRGKLVTRGKAKRADYVLYYKPNIPSPSSKPRTTTTASATACSRRSTTPRRSTSPSSFPRTATASSSTTAPARAGRSEANLALDEFPSPARAVGKVSAWKGLTPEAEAIVLQDYYDDGSGKAPRYYQRNAINAAVEAIAKGQDRILLVMATGTGKTYTAFQIIWRLWKAGRKKRILFLADRNVLVDQTMVNDFRPFGAAMAKLSTGAKTIEREDGTEVELADGARQEAAHRHGLRNLSRPVSGHHRPGRAPEALPGVLARLLRPDRHRRVPPRQRGRGFRLARNPRLLLTARRRSA